MTATILAIVIGLLPIIGALVKWWLDTRPERKLEARRKLNEKIANAIRDGDDAYLSDLSDEWMSQDD